MTDKINFTGTRLLYNEQTKNILLVLCSIGSERLVTITPDNELYDQFMRMLESQNIDE
jgi:hypothetical protein